MIERDDAVWLHVAFDLPRLTDFQRKEADDFRKELVTAGFSRTQYSIYVKYLPRREHVHSCMRFIERTAPRSGKVTVLELTDHQWAQARRIFNEPVEYDPDTPEQLEIF